MAQGPVQILDKPVAHPYVCMCCGVQEGRKFFVDTGLDVNDQMFQPMWEGRIYWCDQFIEGFINDFNRVRDIYLESINELGRGNSDDQTVIGKDDGIPIAIDGNVDESSGSESRTEPPVAATLDSTTINPFLFVTD